VKLLLAALATLALAGCASPFSPDDQDDSEVPLVCGPDHGRLPCSDGVSPGVAYRFNLLTHCGIEWAYFDGRYWVPRPRVDPPSNWAAIEGGTMTLEEQEVAIFSADEGGGARFAPAAKSYRPETCA
jgi:hypothetical protein